MRTVYIGLQRGGGTVGLLNRLITRSRFGHALIAFDDAAFSADGREGWQFERVSEISTATRWYTFAASSEQIANMERWCQHRVGWRYDWVSVFKFTTLWRIFLPSRERRSDREKFFCSEGVYACPLEAAAIRLLGEVSAYEVAPGHFRFSSSLRLATPPTFRGLVL